MTAILIIVVAVLGLGGLLAIACCLAAGQADREWEQWAARSLSAPDRERR